MQALSSDRNHSAQSQDLGQALDRNPSQLEIAAVVDGVSSRPVENARSVGSELGRKCVRPVVVPRKDERGERLRIASSRLLGDRCAHRARELGGRSRLAGSRDGQRQAAVPEDLPRITQLRNLSIVAPLRFDRSRIQALLELVGTQLEGEWLLIGGGAAAAWFAPERTTEDVDLIGLGGTQDERLALMTLAASAAIPIEAVNSAADFFVRRIPGWRDELVALHRGQRATIFRPSATLYLLLKIGRLTATDLEDCLGLVAHTERADEVIDRARVRAALATLPETDDLSLRQRRDQLADALA